LIRRWIAGAVVLVIALTACTRSTGFNARPVDIYAGAPTQSDVRSLFNDPNWWQGPPSFDVLPLDSATMPFTQKYSVTQEFIHLGTSEQLFIRYTVYDSTSSATTEMTNITNAFPNNPTSPKVGDAVVYNVQQGSGGAPFITQTFVRLGQVLVAIQWSQKDTTKLSVQQLARTATLVINHLKNVQDGKVHAKPQAVDAKQLPPPGLELTLLGAAILPAEAWVVMTGTAIPQTFFDLIKQAGITSITYGDYALNNDTHMEVQSAMLQFPSPDDALQWATTFAPGTPDQAGIASAYIPTGGTPAAGEYMYIFVAGQYGGMLICKPSVDGEAATRECESPMEATAVSWKFALSG
jgi:hypothetical protein